MTEALKKLKNQKYVGAIQLADEAARVIDQYVPRQERASVTEVPDERMVRYYSTEGLISPPEARQGPSAVYGYNHLLQLLVIKRLQSDHLPIRKIKELVEGKTERELEQLLDVKHARHERDGSKNAATVYLESLLQKPQARPTTRPQEVEDLSPPAASTGQASAWARVEVEPGLELHIRQDYRLPETAKDRQRLARRMLNEIESHGQGPRK
ncbi:MAG TPA: MerR family transcriptional regulator [Blastocatellia bacterium]|nr:MerR family transcriptional regulator [Blastocatellia bacterium]